MSASLVVYRGPSAYDPSATIRAVLVPHSSNGKTGDMAQLHILPDSVEPHRAQRTGEDAAVCGSCPLRPSLSGGCYVVTCQGPLSVWRATRNLPVAGAATIAATLAGRSLRLGAYGDPAALPSFVIDHLATLAGGRVTGYTHGWQGAPHLQRWCMASVETATQASLAWSLGWRTFRVTSATAPRASTEIECPSERGVACADCLLCRGASIRARSITIPAHGFRVSRALSIVD